LVASTEYFSGKRREGRRPALKRGNVERSTAIVGGFKCFDNYAGYCRNGNSGFGYRGLFLYYAKGAIAMFNAVAVVVRGKSNSEK
jgi:hypothetical protein